MANHILADKAPPPASIPDVSATYIYKDRGFNDTRHLYFGAETKAIKETMATPIKVEGTPPLASISHISATCDNGFDDIGHISSDAETEIFWDAFLDESFSHGNDVHLASGPASAQRDPTPSHTEALHNVANPTVSQVDDQVQGAAESSSYESDSCSSRVDGKHKKGVEYLLDTIASDDESQDIGESETQWMHVEFQPAQGTKHSSFVSDFVPIDDSWERAVDTFLCHPVPADVIWDDGSDSQAGKSCVAFLLSVLD